MSAIIAQHANLLLSLALVLIGLGFYALGLSYLEQRREAQEAERYAMQGHMRRVIRARAFKQKHTFC